MPKFTPKKTSDYDIFNPTYKLYIRVIFTVRNTRHKNPEFGHTKVEIFKNLQKTYISIQPGLKVRKPSILVVKYPVFPFS
jgi:hypothetical protein